MYRIQFLIDFRMLKMQFDIWDIQFGVIDIVEVFFVKEELDLGKVIGKKVNKVSKNQGLRVVVFNYLIKLFLLV